MTKNEAIEKIKSGTSLAELDPIFRKDKDVVLAAVKQFGLELEYADESLKNDWEIALTSLESEGDSMYFISKELWDNEEFVNEALKKYGIFLSWASDRLRNDKSFVLKALKQCEIPVIALGEKLLDDEDVFLKAFLSYHPEREDFQYASSNLKKNPKVVLGIVSTNPEIIHYADNSLFESEEFVKKCIELNPETADFNESLLSYKRIKNGNIDFDSVNDANWKKYHSVFALEVGTWEPDFFNDLDFELIIEALDRGAGIDEGTLYSYLLNNEILNKDDCVMAFLKRQGMLIKLLPDKQDDFEAVLAAVKHNGIAYRFVSPELRKNMQIAQAAYLSDPDTKDYISREVKNSDEWKSFLDNL